MNLKKKIPDWMLERYFLDELPGKERRQLEKELERDPALAAELEELREADRRILAAYPIDQAITQIQRRAAQIRAGSAAPRRRQLTWVAVPALALAALLLIMLSPILHQRPAGPGQTEVEDYVGVKGGKPLSTPFLHLYRKSTDSGRILNNGDTARAGDLLQLAYGAGENTHGVILSIDGAGTVTLHFPEKVEGKTALKQGRTILLPRSYELDRAPRFERFFFITAKEPLPIAVILEKAHVLAAADNAMSGSLDLPAGWGQFSLLLRK